MVRKVKKRDGPGGVGLLLAEGGGSGFQVRPTFLTFQGAAHTRRHQISNNFFPGLELGRLTPKRVDARAVKDPGIDTVDLS